MFGFRVLLKQHRIMKTGSSQHLDQIAYIILASNICRGAVGELGGERQYILCWHFLLQQTSPRYVLLSFKPSASIIRISLRNHTSWLVGTIRVREKRIEKINSDDKMAFVEVNRYLLHGMLCMVKKPDERI